MYNTDFCSFECAHKFRFSHPTGTCPICQSLVYGSKFCSNKCRISYTRLEESFYKSENAKQTGVCPICQNKVYNTKFCSFTCMGFSSRKVENRPNKEELEKLIEENSFCALGRMFGVSDNAVRKWARSYGIL